MVPSVCTEKVESVPLWKPSVVAVLVVLAPAFWVMVGLATVPNGPLSVNGEAAPSAKVVAGTAATAGGR